MKEILSATNTQFKLFVKLIQFKKYRQKEKSYIAEGRNVLDIEASSVKAWIIAQSVQNQLKKWNLPEEKVIILADNLFKKISVDKTSQGLMAWIQSTNQKWDKDQWKFQNNKIYLGLEDIQDPGNLGTMIRTAEAAGVSAIFCSAKTVDIYHPKVIKAAASSLSRVKIITDTDMNELLIKANQSQVKSIATTPVAAINYTEMDYEKTCLIFIGNEGNGLSSDLLNQTTNRIYIPMAGQIESLNAAISAGIILFEVKRQRGLRGS